MAALLVLVSHSVICHSAPEAPHLFTGAGLGANIFFLISGFLITASWVHHPDAGHYFRNRALRIFPALVVPVVGCAYLLGPIVTTLPVADYFSSAGTHIYLFNLLLITIPFLPGVFTTNPYPMVVNGALWTLPIEFLMYVMVAALGVVGLLRREIALIILIAATYGLFANYYSSAHLDISTFGTNSCIVFFLIGTAFYFFFPIIPWRLPISLLCLILMITAFYLHSFILYMVALPYLVFFCVFSKRLPFQRWSKYGDFSYGLYIYSTPVTQTLVHYFPGLSLVWFIPCVFLITLLFAFASWHLVEKHALKLKKTVLHRTA